MQFISDTSADIGSADVACHCNDHDLLFCQLLERFYRAEHLFAHTDEVYDLAGVADDEKFHDGKNAMECDNGGKRNVFDPDDNCIFLGTKGICRGCCYNRPESLVRGCKGCGIKEFGRDAFYIFEFF